MCMVHRVLNPCNQPSTSAASSTCHFPRLRGSQVGTAPVRAPCLVRDGLLREEAQARDHREAAVRELLLLHQTELGGVLRLEAQRVKAQVARVIACARRGQALMPLTSPC